MYNWSVDVKKLSKDKEKYAIWKIEQMVNFGLGGNKLNHNKLRKYWNKIQIDPVRKRFLSLILNEK